MHALDPVSWSFVGEGDLRNSRAARLKGKRRGYGSVAIARNSGMQATLADKGRNSNHARAQARQWSRLYRLEQGLSVVLSSLSSPKEREA